MLMLVLVVRVCSFSFVAGFVAVLTDVGKVGVVVVVVGGVSGW